MEKILDINNKEVLTIEEACMYIGHELSYMHKMCSKRLIPHYNSPCGSKLFFYRPDLIKWCMANKIKTVYEIEQTPNELPSKSKK